MLRRDLGRDLLDALLVRAVAVAVEEVHDDRLDAGVGELLDRRPRLVLVERDRLVAEQVHAAAHAPASAPAGRAARCGGAWPRAGGPSTGSRDRSGCRARAAASPPCPRSRSGRRGAPCAPAGGSASPCPSRSRRPSAAARPRPSAPSSRRASRVEAMKPTDSSAGVVWALPTTNSPARSTMNVSVIVPPASIASTRGSRPFAPSGGTPVPLHRRLLYASGPVGKLSVRSVSGAGSTDTGLGPCPYDLRDGVSIRGYAASMAALAALLTVIALGAAGATAHARPAQVSSRAARWCCSNGPAPGASASARRRPGRGARDRAPRPAPSRPDVPEVGVITVRIPAGDDRRPSWPRAPRARSARRRRRAGGPARARASCPNDPAIIAPDPIARAQQYQWYLHRQHFPAAWDLSRGTGAVVGIIDSGIDSGHPDLGAQDHGRARSRRDDRRAPGDEVGHGTHVSGLACGASNNGSGIAGSGFDCQLVLEKSDLTSSSVIASLVDATRSGAGVINMSFGGGRLSSGEDARAALCAGAATWS